MKRREEIESEAERAAAIMRTHESAERKREEEDGSESVRRKMERERERERERKEASDFSSVTVAFHLTASLPPCLHKKREDVSLSIWGLFCVCVNLHVCVCVCFLYVFLFIVKICFCVCNYACARMWLDEGHRGSFITLKRASGGWD